MVLHLIYKTTHSFSVIQRKTSLQRKCVEMKRLLLKDKSQKICITDIAAFINEDRDCVKEQLEFMYKAKMIDFAGDGRYFILSDKKKVDKTTSKKSDTTDVKAELKKYKKILDEGLIDQSDFTANKKLLNFISMD
jgi:hypothetical protein